MERRIRVTGTGNISITPDVVRLKITQRNSFREYHEAIKTSAQDKVALNSILSELKFKEEDLKTVSFDVDKEYEYYTDYNGDSKKRFIGFKYTHHMKLEFPLDNDLLGRTLYAIARCPGKPDFSIEYTTSDPEGAKNRVLQKAIEDSKRKAELMAKAAGVILGDVITIDYSWGEINFVSRPIRDLCLSDSKAIRTFESPSINMTPDDIEAEDTVTIIWEIK